MQIKRAKSANKSALKNANSAVKMPKSAEKSAKSANKTGFFRVHNIQPCRFSHLVDDVAILLRNATYNR